MGWGGGSNVRGNSLLPQDWHPSHSIPAFWVSIWRCLERAWLLEGTVPWAFWQWLWFQLPRVGQSRLGPVNRQLWLLLPCVLPSPHLFHHAFSKPTCSELCRTSLAFLLFPMSPHLPDLYPSKDPLFPLQEHLRKVAVRWRLFYSSFFSLKCKLQKQERPQEHVGVSVCVCLPGRGLPCTLESLI